MFVNVYSNKFIGSPEAIAQVLIDAGLEVTENKQDWSRYDKSIQCKEPVLHAKKIKYGTVCDCQKVTGTSVTHDIKVGNADEIDALFEEFDSLKDEYRRQHGSHSKLLCDYQMKAYNRGWSPIRIDNNMYGWCYGSTLRSNIGGGRFSMSVRGLSLEKAIAHACEYVSKRENRVLKLSSLSLPKKTLEILNIPEPLTNRNKWQERFGNC